MGGCPHICPLVGPHAPSFGRQLWGLPSRVEYLSPQGVLLPRVYSTTASPLWLGLRGPAAWQTTPSWTVYRLACHRLLPWLRLTFAMVPDAAWPGSDQRPWGTAPAAAPVGRLGRPSEPDPWGFTCCCPSLSRPWCANVYGVLGHLTPVHRCARSVCCVACAVSWATWLLFTCVPARCVALRVQCPGPLGSCSPVCSLSALCCVCSVLGHLAPVHRCARWVCCVACAVSWVTWLLFTGVAARRVALCVRCPGPLGSCSPVCPLGPLPCVCGVLGHLAPVHRCVGSMFCVVCAVSPATWLLFTCVLARWVLSRVRCPEPLGSCSPVCWLRVLCCVCGVLGHLAPVHLCARSVGCVACAVFWTSCSAVCWLGGLGCVCAVLGQLAPVHRCVGSLLCVACAMSWATWLLVTGVLAWCTVLCAQCPGPLWLLPLGVLARCFVLCVRCPGPLGSCSPVCLLGVMCCVVVSCVR